MTLSTHAMHLSNHSRSPVDISGPKGTNNDKGGHPDPSINGKTAGQLMIYVESCDAVSTSSLSLLARGGDGGNTRQSAGRAGNGGGGGQVRFLAYSSRMDVCKRLYNISSNKPTTIQESRSLPIVPSFSIFNLYSTSGRGWKRRM